MRWRHSRDESTNLVRTMTRSRSFQEYLIVSAHNRVFSRKWQGFKCNNNDKASRSEEQAWDQV